MQTVELPIPGIDEQRSIVTLYKAIESRRKLAERLEADTKRLGTVLMAGVGK